MAHQNIDKFFKVSAILFGQQFVDAFGLNYNICETMNLDEQKEKLSVKIDEKK